jgi:hypothetical protein
LERRDGFDGAFVRAKNYDRLVRVSVRYIILPRYRVMLDTK